MRIRWATLEDVRGIVEVHTADEKFSGGIYDRYIWGGPWTAIETLAIHLNNFLLDDQLVAVAELDGKLVGEVEVLFSEEPIGGKVRRIAHIDVIEVHPDYRGRGVGRALMEFVEDVAREQGAEMLTTQPDEDARGFYEKLGFDLELFKGRTVWIPAGDRVEDAKVRPLDFGWNEVKDLELVAGRFQSSYSMYFSAFKDNIAGIHYTVESGKVGDSFYALRNLPGRDGVSLLLWGMVEDLRAVLGRAKLLGFERVLTVLAEDLEVAGTKEVGKIEILGKKLT
ncbi:GNAT family acetyltransferase [Thermococcus eurythermalis]|uniref:GNAT family acetyltransferase n=1 Tax=Thermococcus eurythermalis TaxID=1505907 RepID=A0A097QUB6_9EURY|nr:GNAT family N-acetyltransferase [Thermococcus eurythermalis]AIU70068.1 GNAT family acetyltransferase [Thermococcus eurythermalis]